MRHHARAAIAAVALLLWGAPQPSAAATITIVHVGDTHSHLDAVGPKDHRFDGTLGGLAKAATVIATLKATAPNPLFVHAGDLFNGDLYFVAGLGPGGAPLLSVPEMQLLAGLGLDVLTVGNHDLGLGSSTLAAVLGAAFGGGGPSVLSANLDIEEAGLTGLVLPRAVKEIGGVRVGFFGMTIVDFLSQGAPFLPESYSLEGLVRLAAAEAANLRGPPYDADVVICVAHLGLQLEQAIAANAPGIDAVIGAHDHLALSEPLLVPGPGGTTVPVVKAGEFYEGVGQLTLSVEGGRVSLAGYRLVPVDAAVPRLPAVDEAVQGLNAAIERRYRERFWGVPIAFALADVSMDVDPGSAQRDSGIGNLITDALRARGGTDIGLTVKGFLTEGLRRGFLVRDDAFRIVGDGIDPSGSVLGFPLYRIRITGANLAAALETTLALGDDFFAQVSGMQFAFDGSRAAPPRLVSVTVGGQPLSPTRVYVATVNLGAVQGLQAFPGVELAGPPEPIGIGEYQAVRDWMRRLHFLVYAPEGRIVDVSKLP
jgi:5'-nucleotidase / UDP-sugar diphosphatase